MDHVDLRRRREDHARPKPEAPSQRILRDPPFLLASGFAAGSLASFFLSAFHWAFHSAFHSAVLSGSPGDPGRTSFLLLALLSMLVVLLRVVRRPSGGIGEAAWPKAGSEKQLLMAIQAAGDGITPVEAAPQTSLTVDEAEEILTRFADRGHLVVHSRDGALLYALPGRRPTP